MTSPAPLRTATVNGLEIAYRDRGDPRAPALVLLHGFPGSSDTFAPLLDQLPTDVRVIAPDYPGFGASASLSSPATFDTLSEHIELLLAELDVKSFTLYMFDFGGPVGMRLVERDATRIAGLIFQNANIYSDGLGPGFTGLQGYWAAPEQLRPRLRSALLSAEGITRQHLAGATHPDLVDQAVIGRAIADHAGSARQEAVLDLLLDYQHNVTAYRRWEELVAELDVPVLAIWGEHDPIFTRDGALGLSRHARHLTSVLLDAGHFAALEQPAQVAQAVQELLTAMSPR
ncbi:MAG: alpha/beta fold hydrolase [Actinomycetota bacterium]|nr:alpha/beta fold hydrolase [Actinomycetota bacterium]